MYDDVTGRCSRRYTSRDAVLQSNECSASRFNPRFPSAVLPTVQRAMELRRLGVIIKLPDGPSTCDVIISECGHTHLGTRHRDTRE